MCLRCLIFLDWLVRPVIMIFSPGTGICGQCFPHGSPQRRQAVVAIYCFAMCRVIGILIALAVTILLLYVVIRALTHIH